MSKSSTEVGSALPLKVQDSLDRLLRWQKRPRAAASLPRHTGFSEGDGSYWDRWVGTPKPANLGEGFRRVS